MHLHTHNYIILNQTCLQKLMIFSMYAIDCILEKILTQYNVSQISASCNELLKDFCTDYANRALSISQNFLNEKYLKFHIWNRIVCIQINHFYKFFFLMLLLYSIQQKS